MAASLEGRYGEASEITPGATGQFDVFVNDALVFSKAKTGRFPVDGEVEAIFEALREGREPPAAPERPKAAGFVNRIFEKLRG
ncbi:MAG: Rdx family protein [Deltaproteobacteria bacterium]|nr:Rdx family protein [Deltaproteobacteria bacterium]